MIPTGRYDGSTRHARLRHDPNSPLLWVGDADDWAPARSKDHPLVYPEPFCDVELMAVQNDNNKYTPRFFRFKTQRDLVPADNPIHAG